ncbi:MAG: ACP S-malonyltransferase [Cellvibrionaceae bacterium]
MTTQNLAFVFPGQGSQTVGMLADIAAEFPQIQETFAEASEVLGYDLWELVQTGPQEELNLTERTQPMLLTASVALWRIYQAQDGAQPVLLAGHSLGEWSALVASGVVAFKDAVKLVQQRGKFMQSAVPVGEGAMAAVIGLDDAAIEAICEETGAEAVNYNAPGQVVVAGTAAAVEAAIVKLKEAGAKRAMPLPVSAPFHTTLMRPAADNLAEQINATEFSAPQIPVVHNVHAQIETDPARIKEIMIEQIYSPVRWVSCVQTMVEQGIENLVECGPGKVLCGMAKRIHKPLAAKDTNTIDSFKAVLEG